TLPVLDAAGQARAQALQDARARALAARPAWRLSGRASITRGRDGGSGRLERRPAGRAFAASRAAPVARHSCRLSAEGGGARLEGLDGGPRSGPDGEALLQEATGLVVPVAALGAWLRGLPAAADGAGPARIAYGADLLPARLEQAGWTI